MGQFGSKSRSSTPHKHILPSHCTKPIDTNREKSHIRSTHHISSVEDPNARHRQSRKHRHAIVTKVREVPGASSKSESTASPRDTPGNTPTDPNCHHRGTPPFELSGSHSDEKDIRRRQEQLLLHPVFRNCEVSYKTVSSLPSQQRPRQTPSLPRQPPSFPRPAPYTPRQSPRQTSSNPRQTPSTPRQSSLIARQSPLRPRHTVPRAQPIPSPSRNGHPVDEAPPPLPPRPQNQAEEVHPLLSREGRSNTPPPYPSPPRYNGGGREFVTVEQDASFVLQVDRTLISSNFNIVLAEAARQTQKRDGHRIAATSIYHGLITQIMRNKHRMMYETVYRSTDILRMCTTVTLPPELTEDAIFGSWSKLIPHNAIAIDDLPYALGKVFNLAKSVSEGEYVPCQLPMKQRATINNCQKIMFMKLTDVDCILPQHVLSRFCVPEEDRAQLFICTLECSLEQHGPSVALARLQQILTFCGQLSLASLTVDERTNLYATLARSVYHRLFEPCQTLDSKTAEDEAQCAIRLAQQFYILAGDAFLFLNSPEDIFMQVLRLLESDALHCACWWLFSAVSESTDFRDDQSARECQGLLLQTVEAECNVARLHCFALSCVIKADESVQAVIFRPFIAQLGLYTESTVTNLLNGLGFPLKLYVDQRREIEKEKNQLLRTLALESLDFG